MSARRSTSRNAFEDDYNIDTEGEGQHQEINEDPTEHVINVGHGVSSSARIKKVKRANVNWSTQAEIDLVNLILLHKAHLKRTGGETQEEKWHSITKKLAQSSHFNGQQMTTGQIQMKWNRLAKRVQDRYSVDIDGSSVCHLPDNPDEVTKGVFDILCEAEAKNGDRAPVMRDLKSRKRSSFTLASDVNEIAEQDGQLSGDNKDDIKSSEISQSFRKRPKIKKSRHSLSDTMLSSGTTYLAIEQDDMSNQIPSFEDASMHSRLNDGLTAIQNVLQYYRSNFGMAAENVEDQEDKYVLVEYLTNMSLASQLNVLTKLNITAALVTDLCPLAKSHGVMLRMIVEDCYQFVNEVQRQVGSSIESDLESSSSRGDMRGKVASKVVTSTTDFHFVYQLSYRLVALPLGSATSGSDLDSREIFNQLSEQPVILSSRFAPFADRRTQVWDLDLTPLLRNIDDTNMQMIFAVDKLHSECRTPRSNKDVDSMVIYFIAMRQWASHVRDHLVDCLAPVVASTASTRGVNMKEITADGVSSPISASNMTASPVILDSVGVNQVLTQQLQSLEDRIVQTSTRVVTLQPQQSILRNVEVSLLVTLSHIADVAHQYQKSMLFVEVLLQRQLVSAVSRIVNISDFSDYMKYHNRRLLCHPLNPVPFSYAARRSPTHSPEGSIRIEERFPNSPNSEFSPIETFVRIDSNYLHPVTTTDITLTAATTIRIAGARYAHSFTAHRFHSSSENVELRLLAQARQFSSVLVLLGSLSATGVFTTTDAFMVQNKEEIVVPLILEQLPTAREFRGGAATSWVSSDQANLAQALRSKQLQSTVFAVCIIQVKPHLEQVLNLPSESLSKEVQLTQALIDLFVHHQIPSNYLCVGPEAAASHSVEGEATADLIATVRGHVANMQGMLKSSKLGATSLASVAVTETHARSHEVEPSMRIGTHPSPALLAPEALQGYPILGGSDFWRFPARVERQCERFGCDDILHPSVLTASRRDWIKHSPPSAGVDMDEKMRQVERTSCFHLLDALSKSGALVLDKAELHALMPVTHFLDATLMEAVARDGGLDPLSAVERPTLLMAATLQGLPPQEVVNAQQLLRVARTHPQLFPTAANANTNNSVAAEDVGTDGLMG